MTIAAEGPHRLRVGDVARKTGKSVRALHLYEEMGLLQPSTRSSGGFRLYDASVVERVRWIDLLHEMGFSLQEMRELLRTWWNAELGPDAMDELRALFQRKLDQTRLAISRYQQLESELVKGLDYLETCRVCATRESVEGCVHCHQDHGMNEPALVAGIMTHSNQAPVVRSRSGRADFVRVEEIGRKPVLERAKPVRIGMAGKELTDS
jgi:MerR family copper efflux transcriptional regulator